MTFSSFSSSSSSGAALTSIAARRRRAQRCFCGVDDAYHCIDAVAVASSQGRVSRLAPVRILLATFYSHGSELLEVRLPMQEALLRRVASILADDAKCRPSLYFCLHKWWITWRRATGRHNYIIFFRKNLDVMFTRLICLQIANYFSAWVVYARKKQRLCTMAQRVADAFSSADDASLLRFAVFGWRCVVGANEADRRRDRRSSLRAQFADTFLVTRCFDGVCKAALRNWRRFTTGTVRRRKAKCTILELRSAANNKIRVRGLLAEWRLYVERRRQVMVNAKHLILLLSEKSSCASAKCIRGWQSLMSRCSRSTRLGMRVLDWRRQLNERGKLDYFFVRWCCGVLRLWLVGILRELRLEQNCVIWTAMERISATTASLVVARLFRLWICFRNSARLEKIEKCRFSRRALTVHHRRFDTSSSTVRVLGEWRWYASYAQNVRLSVCRAESLPTMCHGGVVWCCFHAWQIFSRTRLRQRTHVGNVLYHARLVSDEALVQAFLRHLRFQVWKRRNSLKRIEGLLPPWTTIQSRLELCFRVWDTVATQAVHSRRLDKEVNLMAQRVWDRKKRVHRRSLLQAWRAKASKRHFEIRAKVAMIGEKERKRLSALMRDSFSIFRDACLAFRAEKLMRARQKGALKRAEHIVALLHSAYMTDVVRAWWHTSTQVVRRRQQMLFQQAMSSTMDVQARLSLGFSTWLLDIRGGKFERAIKNAFRLEAQLIHSVQRAIDKLFFFETSRGPLEKTFLYWAVAVLRARSREGHQNVASMRKRCAAIRENFVSTKLHVEMMEKLAMIVSRWHKAPTTPRSTLKRHTLRAMEWMIASMHRAMVKAVLVLWRKGSRQRGLFQVATRSSIAPWIAAAMVLQLRVAFSAWHRVAILGELRVVRADSLQREAERSKSARARLMHSESLRAESLRSTERLVVLTLERLKGRQLLIRVLRAWWRPHIGSSKPSPLFFANRIEVPIDAAEVIAVSTSHARCSSHGRSRNLRRGRIASRVAFSLSSNPLRDTTPDMDRGSFGLFHERFLMPAP